MLLQLGASYVCCALTYYDNLIYTNCQILCRKDCISSCFCLLKATCCPKPVLVVLVLLLPYPLHTLDQQDSTHNKVKFSTSIFIDAHCYASTITSTILAKSR